MTIAVGDIHGCLGPLKKLVALLPPEEDLVFLGDYIDRGQSSAGVLRFLRQLASQRSCRFLLGNHEDMLLACGQSPAAEMTWLANGGRATLQSYGLEVGEWRLAPDRLAFLGDDRAFIQAMELFVDSDTAIMVHAGLNPGEINMDRQSRHDILWIREPFFNHPQAWRGKNIIFGHTPTQYMGLPLGHIYQAPPYFGIDTGCVYGGCLTALHTTTLDKWQVPNPL